MNKRYEEKKVKKNRRRNIKKYRMREGKFEEKSERRQSRQDRKPREQ